MIFSLISLFPEVLAPYLNASILGRAQRAGLIQVRLVNPRDFTNDPHRKVDDTPYGGGPGMVLTCQPQWDAYKSLLPLASPSQVLVTSPAGRVFDHAMAVELAETVKEVVIFCGHYEGFDHRLFSLIPEAQPVSMGDFVLTGGELPALAMVDAIARQLPGVVQKPGSVQAESFVTNRLDTPHYTRPPVFEGHAVPEVLLSGNHAEIERFRQQQALMQTARHRPDLLSDLSAQEQQWLNALPEKNL
jgi:tRNA (guanine37-N1)-methyltransferase